MGKKSEQAQASTALIPVEDRIIRTMGLLIAGAPRHTILATAEEQGWNAEPQEIDRYIARAEHELAELAQIDRQEIFGLAVNRLTHLWARALKIQDYKTCLAVQKEINRLYGI